jgi:hypothetical protein
LQLVGGTLRKERPDGAARVVRRSAATAAPAQPVVVLASSIATRRIGDDARRVAEALERVLPNVNRRPLPLLLEQRERLGNVPA